MSKHKNFTINRDKDDNKIKASRVSIGDMFEREGSLHMRVGNCHETSENRDLDKIWICNINTGSVWTVPDDEYFYVIKNCMVSYKLGTSC